MLLGYSRKPFSLRCSFPCFCGLALWLCSKQPGHQPCQDIPASQCICASRKHWIAAHCCECSLEMPASSSRCCKALSGCWMQNLRGILWRSRRCSPSEGAMRFQERMQGLTRAC